MTQKEEIQQRMTELVKTEPPTLMIKNQTYITKVGKVCESHSHLHEYEYMHCNPSSKEFT